MVVQRSLRALQPRAGWNTSQNDGHSHSLATALPKLSRRWPSWWWWWWWALTDNRPRELIKDITRLVVACFPVCVVGKTGTYFTQLQCALPFHFLPCTHFKATQSSILQNSPALIFFTWQQWSALVTDHRGYMNMYSALRSSPPQ